MYHFFSAFGGAICCCDGRAGGSACAAGSAVFRSSTGGAASSATSVSLGSGEVPLSINQLREVRPSKVEEPEDECGDDRHDDHNHGRRANFLRGRPRHLLELGRHLVGEVVDAVVPVKR